MKKVYDKDGKSHECGDEDAAILIKSGHFTKQAPRKQKPKAARSHSQGE